MTVVDETLAARRAGNHRREENALVHMLDGEAVIVTPRGSTRGSGIARAPNGKFMWVSTLHALERKRLVERLRGGRFTLTHTGQRRALAVYRGRVEHGA